MNVSLENHDDAVHDLTIAKNRESSLAGKKQIESELKIILDQSNRTSNKVVQHTKNNLRVSGKWLLPLGSFSVCFDFIIIINLYCT